MTPERWDRISGWLERWRAAADPGQRDTLRAQLAREEPDIATEVTDLAGVSATLYWQVAAIVGAVTGGWLADRWMRQTVRGRIYVSAIGMSLIVPAMFGVGYAPQTGLLWVAIAFLVLFGIGWGFFDSNNMPILSQLARPQLRATGYGIMNLVSISCGGFADWGFGMLRDRHVPLFGIFSVFASAAVISIVLVLLIRPQYLEK